MRRTGIRQGTATALAVVSVVLGSGVLASAAAADPTVTAIDINGERIEGVTLTAVVEAVDTGRNATTAYEWLRCEAAGAVCLPIAGAVADSYLLTAADVGSRIAVTATVLNRNGKPQTSGTSEPTEVVAAQPAPPPDPAQEPPPDTAPEPTSGSGADPEPAPGPSPTPEPTTGGGGGPGDDDDFVQEGVTPVGGLAPPAAPAPVYAVPRGPRYMRPFPVVRIRGELAERGVRVTLLRVRAGRRAAVRVTCRGRGCPVKRLRRGPGRLTPFHRFLPAGMTVTIRVTRPNRIGKHVRLRIRAGRAPARIDACVLPGSSRPAACPAP